MRYLIDVESVIPEDSDDDFGIYASAEMDTIGTWVGDLLAKRFPLNYSKK
jgi:hypothetical protein